MAMTGKQKLKMWAWAIGLYLGIGLVAGLIGTAVSFSRECTGPDRPSHCDTYSDEEYQHDLDDMHSNR